MTFLTNNVRKFNYTTPLFNQSEKRDVTHFFLNLYVPLVLSKMKNYLFLILSCAFISHNYTRKIISNRKQMVIKLVKVFTSLVNNRT